MLAELEHRVDGIVDGIKAVSDNIAHDLRTPLMRLRASIDGLDDLAENLVQNQAVVLPTPVDRHGETLNNLARAVLDKAPGIHGPVKELEQVKRGTLISVTCSVKASGTAACTQQKHGDYQ